MLRQHANCETCRTPRRVAGLVLLLRNSNIAQQYSSFIIFDRYVVTGKPKIGELINISEKKH